MRIDWKQPGLVWLQHTLTKAASAAAIAAAAVLGSGAFHLISDVPWYAVLSAGTIFGLGSVLNSIGSLSVDNGTACYNPNVVAKPKPKP